jgi:hypothetical protein
VGGELAERGALPQGLALERRLGPRVDAQIECDPGLRGRPTGQEARRRERRPARLELMGIVAEGLAGSAGYIDAKFGFDSRTGKLAEGDSDHPFKNSLGVPQIFAGGRSSSKLQTARCLRGSRRIGSAVAET